MPLPKPNKGEDKNTFVSRCVSFVKGEDSSTPNDQAVAMCYTQWKNNKQMNKINLNYNIPIQIKESVEEGLENKEFLIQGIAINSVTTDNNHTFLPEELEKASITLEGRPLLKDHEATVDSIVGRVIKVDYDSIDQNIKFQARINDTEEGKRVKQLIKSGDLNTVSVGANVKELEESEDGNTFIPRGILFKELSLVATPADDNAQFTFTGNSFGLALQEAWKNIKEPKEQSQSKIDLVVDNKQNKEETIMEKDEKSSETNVKEETESNFPSEEFDALKKDVSSIGEKLEAQTNLLSETLNELKKLKEEDEAEPEPEKEPEKEEPAEEKVEEEPKEEPVEEEKEDETKGEVPSEDSEETTEESFKDYTFEKAGSKFSVYRSRGE